MACSNRPTFLLRLFLASLAVALAAGSSARADEPAAQRARDLTPRTFSLRESSISLTQALQALAQQAGVEVADRRQDRSDNFKIKLDLDKVPFWQALDTIAREADLRVSLYQKDGKIALVDGPHQTLPVSYSGIFRVVVQELDVVRILETGAHLCRAHLEIAWEPRFQPLFLESRPEGLELKDDRGNTLKPLENGSGRAAVTKPLALDTQVVMQAPTRQAHSIDLKGALTLVGPSKMLRFTFDNLAKIERGNVKQERQQSQEGVTVKMTEFAVEPERWTARFALQYPAEGPDFESFESWLVNSEIYLEKAAGKQRLRPATDDLNEQPGHRALAVYYFTEENGQELGKAADWKLVYRLPGTILRVPVRFEFKDLALP